MPRLGNMASLAAFGSLAGVVGHKILYVSLMLGLVRPGSAGQPFPTGLPTETTNLYSGYSGVDYTGTLPTQVSEGGGVLFHVNVNTFNQVKFNLKWHDS